MELDQQTDRLPFHDPDEADQARADATMPSHDARIRHLQRVPLFSGFNEDELRRVAELSRIVEVPAGTVITQIGDAGDSFFIIIDGLAAVRTPVGAGSQLQPVDRSQFWRLLDETPELIRRILTMLSRRVRRLEQTIRATLQGPNLA